MTLEYRGEAKQLASDNPNKKIKHYEEIKQLISNNPDERLMSFFEEIYLLNEDPDSRRCMRTYSCNDLKTPWMNTYWDVCNKYMRYYINDMSKENIYVVVDILCTDPEMNRKIKDRIKNTSEYEIRTGSCSIDQYIISLIMVEKMSKAYE